MGLRVLFSVVLAFLRLQGNFADYESSESELSWIYDVKNAVTTQNQTYKLNPETGAFRYHFDISYLDSYKFETQSDDAVTLGCYGWKDADEKLHVTNYVADARGWRTVHDISEAVNVYPNYDEPDRRSFISDLPQCLVFTIEDTPLTLIAYTNHPPTNVTQHDDHTPHGSEHTQNTLSAPNLNGLQVSVVTGLGGSSGTTTILGPPGLLTLTNNHLALGGDPEKDLPVILKSRVPKPSGPPIKSHKGPLIIGTIILREPSKKKKPQSSTPRPTLIALTENPKIISSQGGLKTIVLDKLQNNPTDRSGSIQFTPGTTGGSLSKGSNTPQGSTQFSGLPPIGLDKHASQQSGLPSLSQYDGSTRGGPKEFLNIVDGSNAGILPSLQSVRPANLQNVIHGSKTGSDYLDGSSGGPGSKGSDRQNGSGSPGSDSSIASGSPPGIGGLEGSGGPLIKGSDTLGLQDNVNGGSQESDGRPGSGNSYGLLSPGNVGGSKGSGGTSGLGDASGSLGPGGFSGSAGLGGPGALSGPPGLGGSAALGSAGAHGDQAELGGTSGNGSPTGFGSSSSFGGPGAFSGPPGFSGSAALGSAGAHGGQAELGGTSGNGTPTGFGSASSFGGPGALSGTQGLGGSAGLGSAGALGGQAELGGTSGNGSPTGFGSSSGFGGPKTSGSPAGSGSPIESDFSTGSGGLTKYVGPTESGSPAGFGSLTGYGSPTESGSRKGSGSSTESDSPTGSNSSTGSASSRPTGSGSPTGYGNPTGLSVPSGSIGATGSNKPSALGFPSGSGASTGFGGLSGSGGSGNTGGSTNFDTNSGSVSPTAYGVPSGSRDSLQSGGPSGSSGRPGTGTGTSSGSSGSDSLKGTGGSYGHDSPTGSHLLIDQGGFLSNGNPTKSKPLVIGMKTTHSSTPPIGFSEPPIGLTDEVNTSNGPLISSLLRLKPRPNVPYNENLQSNDKDNLNNSILMFIPSPNIPGETPTETPLYSTPPPGDRQFCTCSCPRN